jgi:hypothetical protein
MYYLSYGDECTIEFRVSELKSSEEGFAEDSEPDSVVSTPVVKNVWFGSQKLAAADDPEFVAWLAKKETTYQDFMSWIRNLSKPKPYFPFLTDVYSAKVVGYVRADDGVSAQGVYLQIGDLISRVDEPEKVIGTIDKTDTKEEKISEEKPEKEPEVDVVAISKIETKKVAILLQNDFYICGVSACHADLRVLLHLNDVVSCQIRPVDSSDKRRLKKDLLQMSDAKVTHIAYLGYVGPKRPWSATLVPATAPFLGKYLKTKLGLSVKEFQNIRSPKMPQATLEPEIVTGHPLPNIMPVVPLRPMGPPPMMPYGGYGPPPMGPPPGGIPGVFGPFIPEVAIGRLNIATNISARAVNIGSPNDPRIMGLLNIPGEIEVAAQVVQILSQALIVKMQNNIHMMQRNMPTVSDLQSQILQVRTAEQVLLNSGDQLPNPQQHQTPTNSLQNQLKEVQAKLQKEAEAEAAKFEAGKAKPIVRDARKILDSYKAEKAKAEEKKPLEYLREFSINKKKISTDKTTIWFGNVGFPKTVRTNYKTNFGVGAYYSLETLYHLVQVTNFFTEI